jgi:enterochelin esterase-like enzyme
MNYRQDIPWRRLAAVICAAASILAITACSPLDAQPAAGEPLIQPGSTATPSATPLLPLPTATPTPQPSATPEPVCSETEGKLENFSIDSAAVGKPLQFIVYTPPCYDPQSQIRYPAAYMLHGQSFNQDQWVRLGMPSTADTLITAGELPPFLIVMPYEEYDLENPFETGYQQAMIEELIPWVDGQYATCTQRACRVVAGLSRGGSWALYLGTAHWDLFGAIGAHSTAPFFGMDGWLTYYINQMGKENYPRLYIDFGESDSLLSYMTEFQKKLDGYGLNYEFRLYPGNHTEEYWSAHVEEYLRWYWKPWGGRD